MSSLVIWVGRTVIIPSSVQTADLIYKEWNLLNNIH